MKKRKVPRALPESMTIGDCYHPAVRYAMTDPVSAQQYFLALVERRVAYLGVDGRRYTVDEAVTLERSNIGYFAGYYGEAERRKVAEVYGAIHPVFGNNFTPSAEEALAAGAAVMSGK